MVLDFSVMLYRLHPLCVDHTLPTRFSLRELSHSNAIRHYFVKYLLTYLTVLDLSCGIRGLRCVMWDLTSKTEPLFGVGVFLCPRVIWFIPFSLYWALEDAARQRLWKCSSWEVQCLKDDTWNTVLKSRWTVCVCHCSQFEWRWLHNSFHPTCYSQQDLGGPLMKRWSVCPGPSNLGVFLISFVTKNAAKLVPRDFWGSDRTGDVPSVLFSEALVLKPWATRRMGCPVTPQERGWVGPQALPTVWLSWMTDPELEMPSQEALPASPDPQEPSKVMKWLLRLKSLSSEGLSHTEVATRILPRGGKDELKHYQCVWGGSLATSRKDRLWPTKANLTRCMLCSRGSSWPRNQTSVSWISWISGAFFTHRAIWDASNKIHVQTKKLEKADENRTEGGQPKQRAEIRVERKTNIV